MIVPVWVAELAREFWRDAGEEEPFPRNLRRAISWAVPLSVVVIAKLSLQVMEEWLTSNGLGSALAQTNRRLRAGLVARNGHGFAFIDGTDSDAEQRFSLAHELAHFLRDYWRPRCRTQSRLGSGAVEVLDGLRAATAEERFQALVRLAPLGFHMHLLDRDNAGDPATAQIVFLPPFPFFEGGVVEGTPMNSMSGGVNWGDGIVRPVSLGLLGQSYRRYRLADPSAEEAMAGSLRRWGQLSPLVACVQGTQVEVLDGFKRLAAARHVAGWASLSVRVLAVDERTAKAAILGLNRGQRPARELEEAWIVQALVRDDGLTQVEAAHLLGQHKSWVCRRLALLEKLSAAVKEDLRLGLLGPALARQLTRLPAGNERVGNQQAVLALTRREALTAQEVSGVIGLLEGASPEQAAFVLEKPREALQQAHGLPTALRDPRLSRAGNWLARHLTQAVEALVRMENWLRTPGQRELTERDRQIVQPLLERLGDQADVVAEQVLGPVRGSERR